MGGEQAAAVLATIRRDNIEAEGKSWPEAEEEAFKAPVKQRYEAEGNPYYATARLWDDGILLPSETRDALGLALAVCANAPVEETRFGVFRM
jgi:3-methylcrotonyl-CoA carboxylase beta subunit